jgi:glycogen debranching enzyme
MHASYDAQHNEFCAYVLPESATPFGLTLGNYKTFATSTPKGGIRGLWDADTDQIIFGVHQIAYRLHGFATHFPHQIVRDFTFLPYAQISEFELDGRLNVTEAFYVPHGSRHDRLVAFVVDVTLHNPGRDPVRVSLFPWALLIGQRFYGEPEKEVRASVVGRFIRSVNEETGAVRWWGGSRTPDAAVVALREQVLLRGMAAGKLQEREHLDEVTPQLAEYVSNRIFGAFEYVIGVTPGARESLRLAVVFNRHGDSLARPALEELLADTAALHETQRFYASRLSVARLMTPSPEISRGVVWAKANMLRIIKEYPQGWGATNSPPSDILVSRDTSWLVHGFDYFLPEFSRNSLEVFNKFLEPTGQVVEYVRGVNGFKTSYNLNINDDTPLHVIALFHHYNVTRDDEWLKSVYPLLVKIADHILSQRDERGLVFCRASGVDIFGISSWRNIIPHYTLSGAVTEINAECYFALEAVALCAAILGDNATWRRLSEEATRLREAIRSKLFSSDTTAFVLNYDENSNYQDNFTADEVFPVLFRCAEPDESRSILRRLSERDFTTPVGLRTISLADGWYFPSHGFGLLGGVWPDLTLWFAVALARYGMTGAAAHWLRAIYAAVEEGSARNTVPGEFPEWFDGGSLTNRGMYLSPWTSAKYLWAVAETMLGLDGYRLTGRFHISPLLPDEFLWAAAVRVHWGGRLCTYVVDHRSATIYGDMREASADEPYRMVFAGRDISDEVTTSPVEVGAIAFEDDLGAVRIFLCNWNDRVRNVSIEFRGHSYRRRIYAGELAEIAIGAPQLLDATPVDGQVGAPESVTR